MRNLLQLHGLLDMVNIEQKVPEKDIIGVCKVGKEKMVDWSIRVHLSE